MERCRPQNLNEQNSLSQLPTLPNAAHFVPFKKHSAISAQSCRSQTMLYAAMRPVKPAVRCIGEIRSEANSHTADFPVFRQVSLNRRECLKSTGSHGGICSDRVSARTGAICSGLAEFVTMHHHNRDQEFIRCLRQNLRLTRKPYFPIYKEHGQYCAVPFRKHHPLRVETE